LLNVEIKGVPDDTSQEKLLEVEKALKLTIPFVENIESSYSQTSVFFLEDKLNKRPEIIIIAKVDGLPKKQFKSAGKGLAETIRNILFSKFENASWVECSINNQFDEKNGFASISRS